MPIDTTAILVDGVRSLVRWGAPEGAAEADELVLMLHDNPGSSEDFEGLLDAVAQFARVAAPDMPGFGKADRPRDFDYTVDGYARHLGGIMDRLGARRVHLVLHDFGGPWGLRWAADHLDRVASVTLVNIGIMPDFEWHYVARIWRTPILGELFQLSARPWLVRKIMNADNPRPFPPDFVDRIIRDVDGGTKRAVLKLYRSAPADGLTTTEVAERFASAQLPALVIWGAEDTYVPASHAEAQRRFFDADVHVIEGAGHWPMIDEPDRVRALLVDFLRPRLRDAALSSSSTKVNA